MWKSHVHEVEYSNHNLPSHSEDSVSILTEPHVDVVMWVKPLSVAMLVREIELWREI